MSDYTSLRWQIPLRSAPEITWITYGPVPGHDTSEHFLADRWCVHLYSYGADLTLDGVPVPVRPGSIGVTPPGMRMIYRYRDAPSMHLFAHMRFTSGPTESIPAMQDGGTRFAALWRSFEEAISFQPGEPLRAQVRLWDILWSLTRGSVGRSGEPALGDHPAVSEAVAAIAREIADPPSTDDLAKRVGLSRDHLGRLFRAAFGIPVKAYIQNQRRDRILHLLRHTQLPIKAVAVELGFDDLHAFNKLARHLCGKAPSGLRADWER